MTVVATADEDAVRWRYTPKTPVDGWFKPGFDDAAWMAGPAPFGADEPTIGRHPRTAWQTADL